MVELKRMLVLPRRFSVAAASGPLSLCMCYCVAAVVVELKRMLVLPRRSSVAAAAAPLQFFFQVPVSLAAVVVELKRMLVLPRRYVSSAPLLFCMCYCALSRLGGRDITGGVCFKNPTGGDFRRTEKKRFTTTF